MTGESVADRVTFAAVRYVVGATTTPVRFDGLEGEFVGWDMTLPAGGASVRVLSNDEGEVRVYAFAPLSHAVDGAVVLVGVDESVVLGVVRALLRALREG